MPEIRKNEDILTTLIQKKMLMKEFEIKVFTLYSKFVATMKTTHL